MGVTFRVALLAAGLLLRCFYFSFIDYITRITIPTTEHAPRRVITIIAQSGKNLLT